jgi:hypothetical protein
MATLITEDGEETEVEPSNIANGFTLNEVYNLLETDMIERRPTDSGFYIIMDEEGKQKGREINRKATALLFPKGGDFVVGTVLMVTEDELQ